MNSQLTQTWLRKKKLAPDNRIKYFASWGQRFPGFRGTRPAEAWQDTLRASLQLHEEEGDGKTDKFSRQARP